MGDKDNIEEGDLVYEKPDPSVKGYRPPEPSVKPSTKPTKPAPQKPKEDKRDRNE